MYWLSGFVGDDCFAQFFAGDSEGEEGAADEVEAYIRTASLEHGNARLAGMDQAGQLLLGDIFAGAGFPELLDEGKFQVDQCDFLIG